MMEGSLLTISPHAGNNLFGGGKSDFSFGRIRLFAVEDCDISNKPYHFTAGFLGDLLSEYFLVFLKIVEFHLDQFMIFEGLSRRLDETFCDAVLSNKNTGLEMMCQAPEIGSDRAG
jgi:hypothetical protein